MSMFNEDLYKKLLADFGVDAVKKYCRMTSAMYNHMHEELSTEVLSEYSYERDWWESKYQELNNVNN